MDIFSGLNGKLKYLPSVDIINVSNGVIELVLFYPDNAVNCSHVIKYIIINNEIHSEAVIGGAYYGTEYEKFYPSIPYNIILDFYNENKDHNITDKPLILDLKKALEKYNYNKDVLLKFK